MAFIPMYYMKLTSNIMSLGGIAIAIGAMVDASIVLVENVHKKLEKWQTEGKRTKTRCYSRWDERGGKTDFLFTFYHNGFFLTCIYIGIPGGKAI